MAEAAVANMSKYFCHQCSQETSPVLPDYTCPRCETGFIEEVTSDDPDDDNIVYFDDDSDAESHSNASHDGRPFADIIDNLLVDPRRPDLTPGTPNDIMVTTPNQGSNSGHDTIGGRVRMRNSSGGSQPQSRRQRTRYVQYRIPSGHGAPQDIGPPLDAQQTLEGLFQHILSNVAGGGHAFNGRAEGPAAANRGVINFDFPFPLFQVLHGNPGDYAWGSGGLDAVITQLLNQLDGTGPPPMPKEEIEQIPTVLITKDQVDKNLQCTVCMDDFKVAEKVKQLSCSHCYHFECIEPWLKLHGTCPICRKELNDRHLNHGTNHGFRGGINQRYSNNSQHGAGNSTHTNNGSTHTNNQPSYESNDDYD